MNIKAVQPGSTHTYTVEAEHNHMRLDSYLAQVLPAYSRSFFKDLIGTGCVTLNSKKKQIKPSHLLNTGDIITITFPIPQTPTPADIKTAGKQIEIVYTHEHFFILNKPAGLIMHPTPATKNTPTLVDWMVTHETALAHVGAIDRPGIVHRLDKDTSGLLIIARTNYGHKYFTDLFQKRSIKKIYHAFVQGHPDKEGSINFSIGRNQQQKHKMAAFPIDAEHNNQRNALTHYRVLRYFDTYTLLELLPVTGRTHQIRVHCAAIGHPLLGDSTYNTNPITTSIQRQALHAYALSFTFDGIPFSFTCPLPADMIELISASDDNLIEKKADT